MLGASLDCSGSDILFQLLSTHSPMIYMLIPRELRDTSELHDVSLYIDDNQHSIGAHKVFD